jgi:hypothetical protein
MGVAACRAARFSNADQGLQLGQQGLQRLLREQGAGRVHGILRGRAPVQPGQALGHAPAATAAAA